MRGCTIQFGCKAAILAALLSTLVGVSRAAQAAAITGVVRDTHGVAQMGAMVQVLAGAESVATVFTDLYGRYRVPNLVAGDYQVRASAALFMPALRANLRLAGGARATVNLTLSMLSDPAAWIPAERRAADEPADEWGWTMRASASRPILRILGDDGLVLVSSGAREGSPARPVERHAAVTDGGGGFGAGGRHEAVTLDRANGGDSDILLRTNLGPLGTAYARDPSLEFDSGYEHSGALGSASRLLVGYSSHPEMMNADGSYGMQTLRVSSAERMRLGDAVELEAGGTMVAVRTTAAAMAAQPFLRVAVHAGDRWMVGYRLATSREIQGFDSLDAPEVGVPLLARVDGRMQLAHGVHQELAATRKAGRGSVRGAIYQDDIARSPIAGSGVLTSADQMLGTTGRTVVADTITNTFEMLGPGYAARGVSFLLSEPLTSEVWGAVQVQQGAALGLRSREIQSLEDEVAGMHPVSAQALTAALNGRVVRSGTKLQISYRWQASGLLTSVAAYEAFSDMPYLGFCIHQTVHLGRMLPPGLEATVEVTNLLAQGYQPFLSSDGRTLFLAEAPRALQGGLSFAF